MNARRPLVFVATVLLLSSLLVSPTTRAQGQAAPRFAPAQIIVKYRPGVTEAERDRIRGRVSGTFVKNLARTPAAAAAGQVELLGLPPGLTVATAIGTLMDEGSVLYAEPNWILVHDTDPIAPSDPKFGQLWGLNNTGQDIGRNAGGTPDADIDAPEAWAHSTGSSSVFIGVIDEGIYFNHEDLQGQVGNPGELGGTAGVDDDGNGFVDDLYGWDFANDDNTVYDKGGEAHGTHVAGTIGANGNNGIGVSGVNWDVGLISAKFLGKSFGFTSDAILAVDYLTDLKVNHGVNIVATNNSWGGGGFSQGLLDAIKRAAEADILFIAAAGNDGTSNDATPHYPSSYDTTTEQVHPRTGEVISPAASYDAVIAVAATGRFDDLREWSNYGPTSVDLAAPGSLILSTVPGKKLYDYYNGTSMATPHVTGTAALVAAVEPLTGPQLRARLLASVDAMTSLAGKTVTGGRLNAHTAVHP